MRGKLLQKVVAAAAALAMTATAASSISPVQAEDSASFWQEGAFEHDGTWYYGASRSNGEQLLFEKMSHPGDAPTEMDGLNEDADRASQSYAWSAQEYGDYIYIGTCYNSTYGIYWRAVYSMMTGAGKTPQEAMQIARDFVQFVFGEQFPETLSPRGIIVKINKKTGEISNVFDSKAEANDPAVKASNCSGYRMAFEKDGKLYFVAMGNPTMFLVEIDPETDNVEIAFKRQLSAEGTQKQISAGVHGLIVYDNEMLMCLAGEESDQYLDGELHPEGGLLVASKDGREWRVIADENDLGPSAYHTYDGLMGGGIWDVIEYNGHLYVTVVRDLTDPSTGIVEKKGFAMYRGTKHEDESFTWEEIVGDTAAEGVSYPYGLGCKYSMACNLWVYNGYLYMGTYNDPMLDLTAVAERADFKDLYYDLYHSIMLYRMDENENIELVGGQTSDLFPNRIGNLGDGLGDNGNQYVWRMETHNDQLWLGTYDTSTLTSVFTQLTDSQLYGMSQEEYNKRLKELSQFMKSLGFLQEKYQQVFEKVLGSKPIRELFDSVQGFMDTNIGNENPVIPYDRAKDALAELEDLLNTTDNIFTRSSLFQKVYKPLFQAVFDNINKSFEKLDKGVYYFGTNYYMKQAQKGFDLFVTEDGVNFDVICRDGLGSEANHGVRTIESVDNGDSLFLGTANPYDGAQIWKLVSSEEPETPVVPVPDPAEDLRKELEDLIHIWKEQDLDVYTPSTADQVKSALEAAEDVLENSDASAEDLEKALKDLQEAIAALQARADKTRLQALLDACEQVLDAEEQYESLEELRTAMEAAQSVNEDPEATQEEVDAAAAALMQAMQNLKEVLDETELRSAMEAAKIVLDNAEHYTPSTLEAVQRAYEEALALLENDEREQSDVDGACRNLLDALEDLQERADTTLLQALVAQAASLNEEEYTAESWEALQLEVQFAGYVLEDPEVSQEDVDVQTANLRSALNALERVAPETVDKTLLAALVSEAKAQKEAGSLNGAAAEDKAAFEKALSEAQTVLDDEQATQDDVDAAWKALSEALQKVKKSADRALLESLVEQAKDELENNENASEEDKKALEEAIEQAENVLQDENASEEDLKKAEEDLRKALENLNGTSVSKETLRLLVETVESVDLDAYLNNHGEKEALQTALTRAKEVLEGDVTQEEVNEATTALHRVWMDLRLAPSEEQIGAMQSFAAEAASLDLTLYAAPTQARILKAVQRTEEALQNPDLSASEAQSVLNAIDAARELIAAPDAGENLNRPSLPETDNKTETTQKPEQMTPVQPEGNEQSKAPVTPQPEDKVENTEPVQTPAVSEQKKPQAEKAPAGTQKSVKTAFRSGLQGFGVLAAAAAGAAAVLGARRRRNLK